MPQPPKTYYEDLGVPPHARPQDIERAYANYRREADRETAVPNPQRDKRMLAAYETLRDPDKREAYDTSLLTPEARKARRAGKSKGVVIVAAVVLVAGAAAGGYFFLKREAPSSVDTEPLLNAASVAVGRVDAVEISGKGGPVGLAFATTCNGVTPTSALTLFWPPRTVPAQVAQIDHKLGVCKLTAAGIGGRPLAMASASPAIGEEVFATRMNPGGALRIVPARVTNVHGSGEGKIVEISVKVQPEMHGSPVMNAQGRVIGIAVLPDPAGRGQVVALTPEWATRPRVPETAPAPREIAQPPSPANPEGGMKTREQIQAERREAVDKAVMDSMK